MAVAMTDFTEDVDREDIRAIRAIPLLSREREILLSDVILAYPKRAPETKWARDELIEHNLRWARELARRKMGSRDHIGSHDEDDLNQYARLGLMRAAVDYDWRRATFTTYASRWIRQAIGRGIEEEAWTVHRPSYVSVAKSKGMRVEELLMLEGVTRPATDEELQAGGLTDAQLRAFRGTDGPLVFSLEASLLGKDGDETDSILAQAIEAAPLEGGADDVAEDDAASRLVQWIRDQLTEPQWRVFSKRNGINCRKQTLEAIGASWKPKPVTRERIRQIEMEALEAIKDAGLLPSGKVGPRKPASARKDMDHRRIAKAGFILSERELETWRRLTAGATKEELAREWRVQTETVLYYMRFATKKRKHAQKLGKLAEAMGETREAGETVESGGGSGGSD